MHTMLESNRTEIKLQYHVMEIIRRKKLRKYNSVYRSYQAQLKGWKHLMIFTLIIHS